MFKKSKFQMSINPWDHVKEVFGPTPQVEDPALVFTGDTKDWAQP